MTDVEDDSFDPWAFQRWARNQRTGTPARKAVLNTLAGMADATTGRCEAKARSLAFHCEMSERSVRSHLSTLDDLGLIARRPQFRRDGGRRGDEYLLLAPGIDEWPDGEPVESPRKNLQGPPEDGCKAPSPPEGEAPRKRVAGQEHPPSSSTSDDRLEHPPVADDRDVVDRLIRFWSERMPGRDRARVTDGRRRLVRARLRAFTARQLAEVIVEVSRQPFYNGQNEASKLYNDLPTIFKNDEKVEGFLADADRRREGATPGGSAGPAPYSQAAQRRAAAVDGTIDALDRMIEMAEQNGGDLS